MSLLLFTVSVSKPSRQKQVESIQMKVNCKIGAIEIVFATERRPLSVVQLQGATAGLVLKASYTQVDCTIASIKVEDLNPATIHKEVGIYLMHFYKLLRSLTILLYV